VAISITKDASKTNFVLFAQQKFWNSLWRTGCFANVAKNSDFTIHDDREFVGTHILLWVHRFGQTTAQLDHGWFHS
jgi:hypothetical protein